MTYSALQPSNRVKQVLHKLSTGAMTLEQAQCPCVSQRAAHRVSASPQVTGLRGCLTQGHWEQAAADFRNRTRPIAPQAPLVNGIPDALSDPGPFPVGLFAEVAGAYFADRITPTRMAVRELLSQEAQHDSGVILRSAGREAMQLEADGQTLTIDVERGIGGDLFYLPATLTWDDGTAVPSELANQIRRIIIEIEDFWGSSAEFRSLPDA